MASEEHGPVWLRKLHDWRVANVSDKMFLLVLAFFVGLLSAVAAFVLHGLIDEIRSLLTLMVQVMCSLLNVLLNVRSVISQKTTAHGYKNIRWLCRK